MNAFDDSDTSKYIDPLPNYPSIIVLDIREELTEFRRNIAALNELSFYEPEVLADILMLISYKSRIAENIELRVTEALSSGNYPDNLDVDIFLDHWSVFVRKIANNIERNNLYKGERLFYQYKTFRPELLFIEKMSYPDLQMREELNQLYNISRWST